jgi:PAS domain S-box-containing protein
LGAFELRSLQHYLVGVAVALALLICAAAALLLYHVDRFGRTQSEQQLLATTRALSLVVDGELKRYEAILRALSTSDTIRRGDWRAFDAAARATLSDPNVWLVLGERSGRQLVNTRLPAGSPLPGGKLGAGFWMELDKGKSRTCNLTRGLVEPTILCVDVPIMRGGRAVYFLSVIMLPKQVGAVLGEQRLQRGSFTTVVDRQGIVVWRNAAPERFVGKPASPDIRRALAVSDEGVRESYSLEGIPTVAAFSRSSISGWTFIVAVPRAEMRAGTRRAFALAAGGAAVLLLVGALVGLLAARRVTRAVKNLAATAAHLRPDETPHYETSGLAEIDTAGQALEQALRAQRLSDERYRRIFEQTSDLILTADLDQVITDCNPAAAAAVGLSRTEALGRKISDFVSTEDFQQTSQMLHQKLIRGGTTRYDVRVRSSTGEWLFWEIVSGLTHDLAGKPVELHVVGRDITERKRAESHQLLLINELNHRVKNTLAVVQSIAHQTLNDGNDVAAARQALEGRIAALSGAHDVPTRESWSSAPMAEIISDALSPFCPAEKCLIEGPELRLSPRTAVSFALAVHELATNAVKYGALSSGRGRVSAQWSVRDQRLHFRWTEEGGPAVEPPVRRGFGSRMIERALASELHGSGEMKFLPTGLVYVLDASLPELD